MGRLRPDALRSVVWLEWSAERTLTHRQAAIALAGTVTLAATVVALGPTFTLAVLIGVFTIVFLLTTVARIGYFLVALRHIPPIPSGAVPVAFQGYSVLVPLYHEANVVPALLDALADLEYPPELLQVLLLVESDDPETRDVCEQRRRPGWKVVVVPDGGPRTKPRALNVGLAQATGELLTIYDAEDRPEREQLLKAAGEFARTGRRVAALQARLDFYNARENLLTRWFTCDYSAHFGLYLEGISALGHPLPLGGTSTHFRTEAVRAVGGWDAWNVTEDCELGMRLAAASFQSRMLDSVTLEEAVSRPGAWIRQRSRWMKGFIQTGLVLLRFPLRTGSAMGWSRYAAALIATAGTPVVFCAQPVFWVLLIVYIVLRLAGTDVRPIEALFPEPLLTLGITSLVFGNFAIVLGHVCALYQQRRFDLVRFALFLPLYWLMGSFAAWRAVSQIMRRPHFWEKTAHGVGAVPPQPESMPSAAAGNLRVGPPVGQPKLSVGSPHDD